MPIKPENRARYPKNWKVISADIRRRSGGQCECRGECGLHRTTGGPRRCDERHGEAAKWAKGTVILTVAHLDHTPENCAPENLKAMCQRCHLRYDIDHHKKTAKATREAKAPQLRLALISTLTPPTAQKGGSKACPHVENGFYCPPCNKETKERK